MAIRGISPGDLLEHSASTSGECPNCGAFSQWNWISGPAIAPGSTDMRSWTSMQCRHCHAHIGVEIVGSGNSTHFRLLRIYPPRRSGVELQHASDPLRAAIEEATMCAAMGAANAAALMCRRAVQIIAREKGSASGGLKGEINSLPLSEELKTLAHSVRIVANDSAHPDPIQWDSVTADDAEELIELTLQIVHVLYDLPARVQELRAKIGGERREAP